MIFLNRPDVAFFNKKNEKITKRLCLGSQSKRRTDAGYGSKQLNRSVILNNNQSVCAGVWAEPAGGWHGGFVFQRGFWIINQKNWSDNLLLRDQLYCYQIKQQDTGVTTSLRQIVARSNRHPRSFFLFLVTVLQVEREVDVLFSDNLQTFGFYV